MEELKENVKKGVKHFILPPVTKKYLIRITCVVIVAIVIFKFIAIPMRIQGDSMAPTYSNGGVNFCWRPAYLFYKPKVGDVVMIRFAGTSVMLLKRIVALEGDQVAFINGKLQVNGKIVNEVYATDCTWNLSPRTVGKGKVYVIGDNRSMDIDSHKFGQVSKKRIVGVPLW